MVLVVLLVMVVTAARLIDELLFMEHNSLSLTLYSASISLPFFSVIIIIIYHHYHITAIFISGIIISIIIITIFIIGGCK